MTAADARAAMSPDAHSIFEFQMPSLGADMESGKVVAWLVKPGDRVERGAIVAEIETDKGVFEVEIGHGGIVDEIVVAVGAKVPVGTVLARLRAEEVAPHEVPAPSEVPTPSELPAPRAALAPVEAAPVPAPPPPTAPTPSAPFVRASPLARRLAEAKGLDLSRLTGTGPSGAITKWDVEQALGAPPPVVAPTDTQLAMRRAVAAAVSRSKREIPHYYLAADLDLSTAMQWLATANQSRPITDRVLPAALLLRGVALALRAFPALNGFWIDGSHRESTAIHLGVAISLRGGGLIAPAIHDADRLTLDEMMRALADLVRRARSGGLRGSEMTDATITVSNLGDEGATSVFGVIYPPQVALVGFGRIAERPWAENGMLGVRPVVTATLAADHRATVGQYGGRFLAELARLLRAPESL
jgi:pyruvate dehydrogenase E2 component (dihydrolipoamide acetyltransferase)